ncbi:hypothetical protein [Salinivirga cyanobacteriivorans]
MNFYYKFIYDKKTEYSFNSAMRLFEEVLHSYKAKTSVTANKIEFERPVQNFSKQYYINELFTVIDRGEILVLDRNNKIEISIRLNLQRFFFVSFLFLLAIVVTIMLAPVEYASTISFLFAVLLFIRIIKLIITPRSITDYVMKMVAGEI